LRGNAPRTFLLAWRGLLARMGPASGSPPATASRRSARPAAVPGAEPPRRQCKRRCASGDNCLSELPPIFRRYLHRHWGFRLGPGRHPGSSLQTICLEPLGPSRSSTARDRICFRQTVVPFQRGNSRRLQSYGSLRRPPRSLPRFEVAAINGQGERRHSAKKSAAHYVDGRFAALTRRDLVSLRSATQLGGRHAGRHSRGGSKF
jgi:hypothetical protein